MRFIVIMLGLLAMPTLVVAELPVTPFEAQYRVYAKGVPAGEGSIILRSAGEGFYSMESRVRATGLARLILRDEIGERVEGRIGEHVEPLHYRYWRKGGSREEHTEYRFNWSAGKIHAEHDGQRADLDLAPRILDPLSTYLQAMWDLKNQRRIEDYQLLDDTRIRGYRVEYQGYEQLNTPIGPLNTIRVFRQRPGSSRAVTFWFARDYDYIPVQVIQHRDGSEKLRMELQSLRRG